MRIKLRNILITNQIHELPEAKIKFYTSLLGINKKEFKLIISGVMKLANSEKNVIKMMSCRKSIFILSIILIDNAIVLTIVR